MVSAVPRPPDLMRGVFAPSVRAPCVRSLREPQNSYLWSLLNATLSPFPSSCLLKGGKNR